MRKIDTVIVHCSATREGMDFTAADIRRWHRDRGFTDIGYHYVVRLDGTVERGRDERTAGAHAFGHNSNSIGICYVGGLDAAGKPHDTRTDRQKTALANLLRALRKRYPGARIIGHRDVAAKACPCFDAKEEYSTI